MRLTNGTILVLLLFHAVAARPLEEGHHLVTMTHGHITGRADPVGPGTSSIADSPKAETRTTSPAGEAGLNETPERVTLELLAESSGYYVKLGVGTPAKTFSLGLNTGRADTWIVGTDKRGSDKSWYDPKASSSSDRIVGLGTDPIGYKDDFPPESTTFNMYTETMTVDDLTIRNVPIGAAQTWSDHTLGTDGDGLLGLGLQQLTASGQKSFLSFLVDEGLVPERSFSVRLINPLWANSVRETSILTLGGSDPIAMDGEFTNLEVHSDLHWLIVADAIYIDGVPAAIATHVSAVVDTRVTVIFGRLDLVRKLHLSIPGSREDTTPESQRFRHFIIPCDSTVALTFLLAGQPFRVSAEQLRGSQLPQARFGRLECWSNVVASPEDDPEKSVWTLGLPFLQTVYTKFTLPQAEGAPAQVSFAKLSEPYWLPEPSPADL